MRSHNHLSALRSHRVMKPVILADILKPPTETVVSMPEPTVEKPPVAAAPVAEPSVVSAPAPTPTPTPAPVPAKPAARPARPIKTDKTEKK